MKGKVAELYDVIYNADLCAILFFDVGGKVTAANEYSAEILECPVEELKRHSLIDFVADEEKELIKKELQELASGDDPAIAVTHRIIALRGTVKWISGNIAKYREPDGSFMFGSGFVEVTKAKQAEEKTQRMTDIMSGMARSFDAFYYGDAGEDTYRRLEGTSDDASSVVSVEKAYESICELADAEILPEYREMFKRVMKKDYIVNELAARDSVEFEFERLVDGKPCWKRGEAVAAERFPDGSVRKFGIFITDINDLKADEFEINRKSSLQSALIDIALKNSGIFEFTYSIPERAAVIPKRTAEEFGLKPRYENMPQSLMDGHVHPAFHKVFREAFEKCGNGEKGVSAEFRNVAGDHWYRIKLEIAQYDKDGAPLLAVGVAERTDELHRAQDEAATLQDACRFAVETHYEAFFLVDTEKDTYTFMNFFGQDSTWMGLPAEGKYDEAIQKMIRDFAVGTDTEIAQSMMLKNLVPYLRKNGQKSFRNRLKTENGPMWKMVECTFFKHDQSKILILITDVQKEEAAKDQLKQAMDSARAANVAKSAFLANMSHEIRTPMNTIIGLSEILMNKKLPADINNSVTMIQNAASGLLAIINDILDFSKIESGKFEITPVDYMLPSLLMDINNMISVRLVDKPVYFLINVDHLLPNHLMGDDIRIKQILMNLLGNAVKFTKEGFIELRVTGQKMDDSRYKLIFKVIDSGIGIKKEDFGKLFGTFSQVDTTKNRAVTGSGLGLAISKSFSEMMGGGISVESEYGRGTTFTVEIMQQVKHYEPIGEVQQKEKVRMLICENDETVISSISRTLENLGVEYRVCREFDKVRTFEDMTHVMIRRSRFFEIKEKLNFMFEPRNIYLILRIGEHASSDYMQYKQLQLPLLCMQVINAINGEIIASSYKRKNFDRSQIVPLTYAHVLIVDDNVTNLQVARGLMSPYRMNIDVATSGFKAIDMVKSVKYDIVFMDHMMPEMDGIETAKHIRELKGDYYKTLPIVALTANAMSDAKEAFLKSGMDDFIAKPIEMTELHRVLKHYVQSKAPAGYLEKYLAKSRRRAEAAPDNEAQPALEVQPALDGAKLGGGAMGQLLIQNNALLSQNMLLLRRIFGSAEAQPEYAPAVPETETAGGEPLPIETENTDFNDASEVFYETIPEVNMAGALETYGGSVPVYHNILKTYQADIEQRAPELQKLYEAKDVRNFTICVHAIKSASRGVGADALGELAYLLEKAGKANDWDTIEKQYGQFAAELHKMVENTGRYVRTYLEKDGEAADAEKRDAFAEKDVEMLKLACRDMDYSKAEDILQEMQHFEYPENYRTTLSTMIRYCGEYEYEKLEQIVQEL